MQRRKSWDSLKHVVIGHSEDLRSRCVRCPGLSVRVPRATSGQSPGGALLSAANSAAQVDECWSLGGG